MKDDETPRGDFEESDAMDAGDEPGAPAGGGRSGAAAARALDVPRPGGQRSFLEIYKKSQGYYTRVGTACGAGLLTLAGGHFVWSHLTLDESTAAGMWLKTGIPLLVVALLALLTYWVVGVNRKACDFMIATEGEMKKVNWASKRELKASTGVVILVTLLLAGVLFCIDYGFMSFFSWIGVLRS